MNKLKYFLQYVFIIFLFLFFKLVGYKISLAISSSIFLIFGNFFRSKKTTLQNIRRAMSGLDENEIKNISKRMWSNYGKIFVEYLYLAKFRNSIKYSKKIKIINQHILDDIKNNKEPVIFVSGHFNNFELMAMHLEKSGIDLAAIYRPLNNPFLNPKMEILRQRFICQKQVKKGISGTKQILKFFKNKTSVALMIDQRVTQGINCKFFNENALTTTIPAQFAKKYGARVVPIYIERLKDENFNLTIYEPIKYNKNESIEEITLHLNQILEKMILKNPDQWIWTHNRWKK